MSDNDWFGLAVIGGVIVIGLMGGVKGAGMNGLVSSGPGTPTQKNANIQYELNKVETQVDILQKQIEEEEAKKQRSVYYGQVNLQYVNRSSDPSQEYITLYTNSKTVIPITGWTLASFNSGVQVKIPKGTYLFFADQINSEQDIYVTGNDIVYIVTGYSPNGASFKLNKCSGYLSQFQNFVPYLSTQCPAPRDEDLSSIPNRTINDACLTYIESFPTCRIQTTSLPQNWSIECYDFIYNKINYPSCVNTHKNDKDFYLNEWRIYLKRSDRLWKNNREHIILYDSVGKIVSELKY